MNLELYTDDELMRLKCEAVELEDMRTYKQVIEELNRRERNDL